MYIRISLEDTDLQNGKAESNSITNQRELIRAFIQNRNEFSGCRVKEFFNDGFTGRNFDRLGFQNMIAECRTGKVRCVVVKDLSRLGRNYVEVGNLLEQFFPFLGVRVAIIMTAIISAGRLAVLKSHLRTLFITCTAGTCHRR